MRSGGRYILGIDALPRGTYAAIAVGRTITSTIALLSDGGRPLPLEERVRVAVAEAEHLCGAAPTEVRLVCVDDGSDGLDLERVQEWLTQIVETRILILDLFGSIEGDDIEGSLEGIEGEAALSVARACEAALW